MKGIALLWYEWIFAVSGRGEYGGGLKGVWRVRFGYWVMDGDG